MKDLISIIVPVYNVEKYLNKCVDSILNQTYKELEVILVDDGSTDNSAKLCDEYAQKDERIKVIHKQNRGLISAWLEGLNYCNGKYLGFVDSDDYISQDMYEKLHSVMVKDNSELAICGVNEDYDGVLKKQISKVQAGLYTDVSLNEIKNKLMPSNEFGGDILRFYRVNKLYLKDKFVENLKYVDTRVTHLEDLVITFPYLLKANSISIIEDCCYYYYIRQNSITKTDRIRKNMESIILVSDIAKNEANDIQFKNFFKYEYIIQNSILGFTTASYNLKKSKEIYKELNAIIEENHIKFTNPNFSKLQKIKVFLLTHKMYFILYALLKIKLKLS